MSGHVTASPLVAPSKANSPAASIRLGTDGIPVMQASLVGGSGGATTAAGSGGGEEGDEEEDEEAEITVPGLQSMRGADTLEEQLDGKKRRRSVDSDLSRLRLKELKSRHKRNMSRGTHGSSRDRDAASTISSPHDAPGAADSKAIISHRRGKKKRKKKMSARGKGLASAQDSS